MNITNFNSINYIYKLSKKTTTYHSTYSKPIFVHLDGVQSYDEKKKEKFNDYLSSNNYLGIDLLFPKLKKGWVSENPWIGINAQQSYFHVGYATGNATKIDTSGLRNGKGYIINAGIFYNHPIHIVRNLITVEPEIGLDFIMGRFKDDPSESPIGIGFGVTPGLGIKIGPVKFVAKYCASFAVNAFDRTNAWAGGMSYPVLSAYFETGWGLMNPKNIQSNGIFTTQESYEKFVSSEIVGNTIYDTYKVTTVYNETTIKSSIYDIGPFWYISPKVSSSRVISRDNRNTFQLGGALGGRVGIIGGDVYYTVGSAGFGSALSEDQMKKSFGEIKDHSGYVNASTYGMNGGFEFFGLLTKIFVTEHEDRSIYSATRFMRLFFTGGYGGTSFNGNPVYNSSTARNEIDFYNLAHPSETIDTRKIAGSVDKSTFYSLGFKIEMGLVSVGFDKYIYKDAKFADGYVFTAQYFIPPGRLLRSVRLLKAIKKVKK